MFPLLRNCFNFSLIVLCLFNYRYVGLGERRYIVGVLSSICLIELREKHPRFLPFSFICLYVWVVSVFSYVVEPEYVSLVVVKYAYLGFGSLLLMVMLAIGLVLVILPESALSEDLWRDVAMVDITPGMVLRLRGLFRRR